MHTAQDTDGWAADGHDGHGETRYVPVRLDAREVRRAAAYELMERFHATGRNYYMESGGVPIPPGAGAAEAFARQWQEREARINGEG